MRTLELTADQRFDFVATVAGEAAIATIMRRSPVGTAGKEPGSVSVPGQLAKWALMQVRPFPIVMRMDRQIFSRYDHPPKSVQGGVDVLVTHDLTGVHRVKHEDLLHRIFASAQLDFTVDDRFGHPARPREWFPIPIAVIDEAVTRIRYGSVARMVHEPGWAVLVTIDPL